MWSGTWRPPVYVFKISKNEDGRKFVSPKTSKQLAREDITFTRGQETELPRALKWRFLSADEDYEAVTVEARRITVDTARIAAEQFPIAHPPSIADRNARRALLEAWVGREQASFTLPPSRLALDPTDVLRIDHDGRVQDFAVTRVSDGDARRVEAQRRDAANYALAEGPARPLIADVPMVFGPPEGIFLDLPQLTEDLTDYRPLAAVAASPWYGAAAIWRAAGLDGFERLQIVDDPAQLGIERWQQFTGANAVLADTGEPRWAATKRATALG